MTADDSTVTPLRRPRAEQQTDRINTALALIGWHPWCEADRPAVMEIYSALTGVPLEDLAAARRAPETGE